MQWSDNQCRLFVPSCWDNQRRLHSAPWVLTQTRSCFLPSRHLHFYLTRDAYLCSRVIITIVFFCRLHSSQNRMYWPDNATSKYKLISRFITVNYVRICINCRQYRLLLTHTLLGLHHYHHHCPCSTAVSPWKCFSMKMVLNCVHMWSVDLFLVKDNVPVRNLFKLIFQECSNLCSIFYLSDNVDLWITPGASKSCDLPGGILCQHMQLAADEVLGWRGSEVSHFGAVLTEKCCLLSQ